MKNSIIAIVVSTLLFASCTSTKNYYNYIVNGDEVETLKDANGQPTINVKHEHHIDVEVYEGHPPMLGLTKTNKSVKDNRSIDTLYRRAVERIAKDTTTGPTIISVGSYIKDSKAMISLEFKKTNNNDILDLTIIKFKGENIIIDFIPFAYHPALIYDKELMITAGIISFRKREGTNLPKQPDTLKFQVRIPKNSYEGKAMEVVVANPETTDKHDHIGNVLFDEDAHRYGHKVNDPREEK